MNEHRSCPLDDSFYSSLCDTVLMVRTDATKFDALSLQNNVVDKFSGVENLIIRMILLDLRDTV